MHFFHSMKLLLSLLLVVFTFLGVLDASYITYEKFTGQVPTCTVQFIHFKCAAVLNSPWASVGPVPLSLLGVAFYMTFFVLAVLFYLGKEEFVVAHISLPSDVVLATFGCFGALFSLYLILVMAVILQAWCLYCVLSALTCLTLFLLGSSIHLLARKERQHAMYI